MKFSGRNRRLCIHQKAGSPKFRANFYNAADAQLLHEKGEIKTPRLREIYSDITRMYCSERFNKRKGRRRAKRGEERSDTVEDSGESLSLYASLKFFRGASKFLARQTPFLHLLRVAKGTIIFHLRYRATLPSRARGENRRGRVVSGVKNHWR